MWPVLTTPRRGASLRQRLGIFPTVPCGLGPGLRGHLLPSVAFPPGKSGCTSLCLQTRQEHLTPAPLLPRGNSFPKRTTAWEAARGHHPAQATERDRVHDLLPGTRSSCPNSSQPRPESRNTITPEETPVFKDPLLFPVLGENKDLFSFSNIQKYPLSLQKCTVSHLETYWML